MEQTLMETNADTNSSDAVSLPVSKYDPDRLLNEMKAALQVPNDSQLAKRLELSVPVICKIRKRVLPVTPTVLLTMHEESGYSIRDLRYLMGDMRPHTGKSAGPWPAAENYVKRNFAAGPAAAATA
jgi:antitoxin HigA-1